MLSDGGIQTPTSGTMTSRQAIGYGVVLERELYLYYLFSRVGAVDLRDILNFNMEYLTWMLEHVHLHVNARRYITLQYLLGFL